MCMLKRLIKVVIWNVKGGYKPKAFWDNFAKTFMDDPWQRMIHSQHRWMFKKIKQENPKTVLEVGCGFGRNIKFLIEKGIQPERITGIDISSVMIRKAKSYIGKCQVKLFVGDVCSLPFKRRAFDVVLMHGVLMHVKPQDVEKAAGEVARVSRNALIGVEQNYNGNEYTFVHNYRKLFQRANASVIEYVINKKEGLDYFYVKVR